MHVPGHSTCKYYNTAKYLIVVTPQGVISFISKGWGGCASDQYITDYSGFLRHILVWLYIVIDVPVGIVTDVPVDIVTYVPVTIVDVMIDVPVSIVFGVPIVNGAWCHGN